LSTWAVSKGFGCSNVVNYEVVLASSQIVNVNQSSNPDLFIALKGGANNFGVVTGFDMDVLAQNTYWAGFIGKPISARSQLFSAITNFSTSDHYDKKSALISLASYSRMNGWGLITKLEYTAGTAAPKHF
jgi:hypothetical protein